MAETLSAMGDLCNYSQKHPELSARESLQLLSQQIQAGTQRLQLGNVNPQHPGHPLNNPALQQPPPGHYISPAPQHLGLPMPGQNSNGTSPGTLQHMSPAMHNQMLQHAHLQGTPQQAHQLLGQAPTSVGMVATQSQQGTNNSGGSQGTSANASPNVTNKRRRPSAVKVEGEEAAEINGVGPQNKVKQSPRVGGGTKRQKANG